MDADGLEITLHNATDREQRTRDQLLRVAGARDLSRWLFTREILIEEGSIPFSHPVLRVNTRHLDQDDVLLATFVHEQLHWHVTGHWDDSGRVLSEFRRRYPNVPVGHPEGATDEGSSYLHLLVNWLEVCAMRELVSARRLKVLRDFWLSDHYTGIYAIVLRDEDEIGRIVAEFEFPTP